MGSVPPFLGVGLTMVGDYRSYYYRDNFVQEISETQISIGATSTPRLPAETFLDDTKLTDEDRGIFYVVDRRAIFYLSS